mgnify:CR=1 FL=1
MDYSLIEVFFAILETGNITKASEILHLSQSTVTQRLRALEEELEISLFNRNRGARSVELTPQGHQFINIAEKWKSLLTDAYSLKISEQMLSISIASVDSLNSFVFAPLYKNLSDNKNITNLRIITKISPEIYSLVEKKDIDIGIAIRKLQNRNLKIEPLFEEKMVLVRKGSNDYPNGKKVHPHELDPRNELYMDWGMDYQIWHNYWWDPLRSPHITIDTFSLLVNFLDNPKYWAILPSSIVKSFTNTLYLKYYDISPSPPNRVCYKITHQNPSSDKLRDIEIFESYLKDFISNLDLTI